MSGRLDDPIARAYSAGERAGRANAKQELIDAGWHDGPKLPPEILNSLGAIAAWATEENGVEVTAETVLGIAAGAFIEGVVEGQQFER